MTVDTNTVEGGWQIPKEHFKMRHGCELTTFEGHLSEVIWRNHHRGSPGDVYEYFFILLNNIFTHRGPARMNSPRPLFDTWAGDLQEGETVKVHPMFDDSPALPNLTPSGIRVAAALDHDYELQTPHPAASDDKQATASNKSKSSSPSSAHVANDHEDRPSTSRAEQIKSPLPPADNRGYRHVYHPPEWAPVEADAKHEEWSSSSSDGQATSPKLMNQGHAVGEIHQEKPNAVATYMSYIPCPATVTFNKSFLHVHISQLRELLQFDVYLFFADFGLGVAAL